VIVKHNFKANFPNMNFTYVQKCKTRKSRVRLWKCLVSLREYHSSEFIMCNFLKVLFQYAFVSSRLEYGVVIWDPLYFTRFLPAWTVFSVNSWKIHVKILRTFLQPLSFKLQPVLEKLNLDTLSNRKINADLVFLTKLISGEVDAP